MGRALQALLISPDQEERAGIVAGRVTVSVRPGFRDYSIGTVMLCCHIEPWAVMADIVRVHHCELKNVPEDDCYAAGCRGREELLQKLRRFYPEIGADSTVTLINWMNVRGKLVDAQKQSEHYPGRCV